MKKLLTFIILSLVLVSSVSAFLGFFEKNECVNIVTILNTTAVNLSSISDPDGETVYLDEAMQKNGQTFNFTFCNTSVIGNYNYDYIDLEGNPFVNNFEITNTGRNFSDGQSNVSVGILMGALVLGFMFLIIGLFLWKDENSIALGFLFISLAIILGIYSLHLGYAFSNDIIQYETLTPVVSAIYISILWLLTGIGILSMALMLIAFIKQLGKINETEKFGEDFNPITQTYDF